MKTAERAVTKKARKVTKKLLIDMKFIFSYIYFILSYKKSVVVNIALTGFSYGYPDEGYLQRVTEDLAAKGIK